jgi:hypothetical protein
MVDEVATSAAPLPLLQTACAALWEGRNEADRVLRASVHAAMGGVAGAVASHAESVLTGMDAASVALCRRILLRMHAPDGTSVVEPRPRLEASVGEGAASVISALVAGRVLVEDVDSGVATLGVCHEAIFSAWPRLRSWIEQSGAATARVRDLEAAALAWERAGRAEGLLWEGDAAEAVLEDARWALLGTSLQAREFAGHSRDRALRSRRRRRTLVTGAWGALVLIAVGSAIVAARLRSAEERTQRVSVAREAELFERDALAAAQQDRTVHAAVLAEASVAAFSEAVSEAVPATALRDRYASAGLGLLAIPGPAGSTAVAIDKAGARLLLGTDGGDWELLDLRTGSRTARGACPLPGASVPAFLGDAALVACSGPRLNPLEHAPANSPSPRDVGEPPRSGVLLCRGCLPGH